MIEKNTLLNEEKYEDVVEAMRDKYVGLFSKMLDKKNCPKPENEDFYCYTTKIMNEYPEIDFEINTIRQGMLDDKITFVEQMELLKNTYNKLELDYLK